MKSTKKIIGNLLLCVLLIGVTLYVIIRENNMTEMMNILKHVEAPFIIVAIAAMCVYVFGEAFNIRRTLKILDSKISMVAAIKYALIGFFFSGITPAASGGQPMQIYYMHKDGISVAKSTLALLINLTSMQVVTISLALVSVVINHAVLTPLLIVCFIVGILLNLSALALLVIAVFMPKLARKIVHFCVRIMNKFHVKNIEQKKMKLENELEKYQQSSSYIKENKVIMLKTFLMTYVQFIAYYSVSYWVYRALGFNASNIFEIVTLQAVLYATVSGIPSPGAIGVSEGGYMEIFKNVYTATSLSGAMLLTRLINFYGLIILGAVITILNIFRMSKKISKNNVDENLSVN